MLKNLPEFAQPVHPSWDWNSRVSSLKVMVLTSTLCDGTTARVKGQGFLCWGLGSKGSSEADDDGGDDGVVVVTGTQKKKRRQRGISCQVSSWRPHVGAPPGDARGRNCRGLSPPTP